MNEKPKYWVPALEKAHLVLTQLARHPGELKLMDLSRRLTINKSSMFSLLATLEALQWIKRESGDTYAIGPALGELGYVYLQRFDAASLFREAGQRVMERLGETIQFAKLDGCEVLYVDKLEAPTPIRLVSEPGMRLPSHATALGKSMLAFIPEEALPPHLSLPLQPLTKCTITDPAELKMQLKEIAQQRYALDLQEAVMGFHCIAAPVFDRTGQASYAVSCSMPIHCWAEKFELARDEICALAQALSDRMHHS